MRFQFTVARLMRSTAFFAVGLWAVLQLVTHSMHDQMRIGLVVLVFAAFGGAIGALFGKTPMGVFIGIASIYTFVLVTIVAVVVMMLLRIM